MAIYLIEGRVTDRRTAKPVSGLRVEARDKDVKYHDIVGVETTNRDGRFTMRFTELDFGDHAPDRLPDLVFRVLHGERVLLDTIDRPLMNQRPGKITVELQVSMPAPVETTNRVSARTIKTTVDTYRRSDIKGTAREFGAKAGLFGSLVGGMITSKVKQMAVAPLRPSAVSTKDVVGSDVASATKKLEAKGMRVAKVEQYDPANRGQTLKLFAEFPTRVNKDDEVTLIEENGRVKYYTVTPPDGGVTRAVAAAAVRAFMGMPQTDAAAIDEVRTELSDVKREAADKDRVIVELRGEIQALKDSHQKLAANVDVERLTQLEAAVRKLSVRRPQ
jgi:hypothetical protein